MLNIIPSKLTTITPMNYYLTFDAVDSESELQFSLRINRQQRHALADIILLADATQHHVDIPLGIPMEITRTMDAGDGVNSVSENLSTKVIWVAIKGDVVTLSVAGYQHAISIESRKFYSSITKLYRALTDSEWEMTKHQVKHPQVGDITVWNTGNRYALRHQDMLLVAEYSNMGMRRNKEHMTFYVQDTEGLWIQTPHVASARWGRFVSQTTVIPK